MFCRMQLITTSKILWSKHVRLQWAIGPIATGVMCVAVGGAWPQDRMVASAPKAVSDLQRRA